MEILKAAIYPEFCIGCNNLGKNLCMRCDREIDFIDFPICMICGNLSTNGTIHKFCNSKFYPISYQTPYKYSDLVKKIILKSKSGSNNYKLLNTLIHNKKNIEIIKRYTNIIDIIIYIPMTNKSSRFVDHGKYIAEQTSQVINKPTFNILTKAKTQANKKLSRSSRFQNLKDSIIIKERFQNKLKSKSVLLIDDISTTGASLLEASKVLYKCNVKEVHAYSLAKET